jgi:hypothetical protein
LAHYRPQPQKEKPGGLFDVKHKTGKSCLYVQRLSDLHIPTLKTLMKKSIAAMKKKYPDKK